MARKRKQYVGAAGADGRMVVSDATKAARKRTRAWVKLARELADMRQELANVLGAVARFKGGSEHGDACQALNVYMGQCIHGIRHAITGSGTSALSGEYGMISDLHNATRWVADYVRTLDNPSPLLVDCLDGLAVRSRSIRNRANTLPPIDESERHIHAKPHDDDRGTLREVRVLGRVIFTRDNPVHVVASVMALESARQCHKARVADLESRIAHADAILANLGQTMRLTRSKRRTNETERTLWGLFRESERVKADRAMLEGRLTDLQTVGYPVLESIGEREYRDARIAARILLRLGEDERGTSTGDVTVRRVDPRRPDLADAFQTLRRGTRTI